MSTNTITQKGASPTISNPDLDQYYTALENDVVPRNSGAATDEGGRLGTPTYQWDKLYVKNGIYLDGSPIGGGGGGSSGGSFSDSSNYILSSSVQADGNAPNFLIPSGSTNTVTIKGLTTPLEVVINGASAIFSTDVTITGLTSAPATNNTCLVNDASLAGAVWTRQLRRIPYDTAGSNITAKDGQIVGFLHNSEYFLAYVDNTNLTLTILKRGAFLNSSSAAIVRTGVSDNATITLMSTAWVYADNTGTSAAVGYTSPTYSGTAPASPATGDYWYDLTVKSWKIWSGAAWSVANRTLIGVALINSAGVCVAALNLNTKIDALPLNTIKLRKYTNSKVISLDPVNNFSVNGSFWSSYAPIVWDMAVNLDTSLTEANNTPYYFYLTHQGKPIISDEIPEWRADANAWYHPYKTYLYIGRARNDGSGNLQDVRCFDAAEDFVTISSQPDIIFYPDFYKYYSYKFDLYNLTGGGGSSVTLDVSTDYGSTWRTTTYQTGSTIMAAAGGTYDCVKIDVTQFNLSSRGNFFSQSNKAGVLSNSGSFDNTAPINAIRFRTGGTNFSGSATATPIGRRQEVYQNLIPFQVT